MPDVIRFCMTCPLLPQENVDGRENMVTVCLLNSLNCQNLKQVTGKWVSALLSQNCGKTELYMLLSHHPKKEQEDGDCSSAHWIWNSAQRKES